MKIKGEDGNEIEVFTSEEVEKKAKEAAEVASAKAVEDFKAANPDKSAEIDALKNKLTDAEELLKAAEEGGQNKGQIERLRKERDEAKKVADEATKNIEKKIDEFKNEIIEDTKVEMLDKLSKGDPELRKKIEFEFDNYRPNDNTKKGVTERMEKAYQLATGRVAEKSIFDGNISAGDKGDGGGFRPTEKKEYNKNENAIGSVLGVTDEDRKNYEQFSAEQAKKKAAGLIP